jgi:DNA-binding NarL/FixJ family response regulator
MIDDHPVVRAGLRRLLASAMEIDVREVTDSREALSVYRDQRPNLVVLDIDMAACGGIEVLTRLIAEDANARVLIFSMHAEPMYATQALQFGALGYISKGAPPDEIIVAVQRVSNGDSYIEHQIAQEMALRNIPGKGGGAGGVPALTRRDVELLKLVSQGASLTEMAATIGVSYKTIANTLSALKMKLGVSRTSELVHIAIKNGISD